MHGYETVAPVVSSGFISSLNRNGGRFFSQRSYQKYHGKGEARRALPLCRGCYNSRGCCKTSTKKQSSTTTSARATEEGWKEPIYSRTLAILCAATR